MKKVKVAFWINAVLSGIFAILISWYFSIRGIAEPVSGDRLAAPGFLLVIPIWLAGVLIGRFIYTKKEAEVFLFLSLVISWGSIPLGIKLGDFFFV